MTKQYSNFDVLAYEREVSRRLEQELDRQSSDYKRHNKITEKKLSDAIQKLQECILLKDETVRMRANEI
jgi:hypothetical protein